jgi:hypothetical protein
VNDTSVPLASMLLLRVLVVVAVVMVLTPSSVKASPFVGDRSRAGRDPRCTLCGSKDKSRSADEEVFSPCDLSIVDRCHFIANLFAVRDELHGIDGRVQE